MTETVERETRGYGRSIVEGVLFTAQRKLDLAAALKEQMEERRLRIPPNHELRGYLRSIRKTAGPTGAPRIDIDASVQPLPSNRSRNRPILECKPPHLWPERYPKDSE